ATAKVTPTPDTGFEARSRTITAGGVATAVLTCADWPSPALGAIVVALPCVAVAEKGTGEPARLPTVAVAVCVPAVFPSTRVALAIPLALVAELGVMEPPPLAAQVTVTAFTGFAARSVTSTV